MKLAAYGFVLIVFPVMWMENAGPKRSLQALSYFKTRVFISGSHLIMTLSNAANEASENMDLTPLVALAPIGSSIPADSQERIKRHFPNLMVVFNRYGLTEVD